MTIGSRRQLRGRPLGDRTDSCNAGWRAVVFPPWRIHFPQTGQKQVQILTQVKVGVASAGGMRRQGGRGTFRLRSIASRYGAHLVAILLPALCQERQLSGATGEAFLPVRRHRGRAWGNRGAALC